MSDEKPDKENQNDSLWETPGSEKEQAPSHSKKTVGSRRLQGLILLLVFVISTYLFKFWVFYALFLFLPIFIFYIDYLINGVLNRQLIKPLIVVWFIIAFFALGEIPGMLNARRSAWENRCKLTLRALGSIELAYFEKNNRNYATFENLYESGFIEKGYNPGNLIEKYVIYLFDKKPDKVNKKGKIVRPSSFTIIAIPQDRRNHLRTFAIGDDQIPCVWVGDSNRWEKEKASLHNNNFWEPLR